MFLIDILNPYQRRINSLQLFAHKKARHRLAQPKKDWEKCTLSKDGVKLQINCRKIAPRGSAGWEREVRIMVQ